MSEYGISFVEIETQWTDRQLMAMMQAMNKRYEKVNKARGVTRRSHTSPAEFAAATGKFSVKRAG